MLLLLLLLLLVVVLLFLFWLNFLHFNCSKYKSSHFPPPLERFFPFTEDVGYTISSKCQQHKEVRGGLNRCWKLKVVALCPSKLHTAMNIMWTIGGEVHLASSQQQSFCFISQEQQSRPCSHKYLRDRPYRKHAVRRKHELSRFYYAFRNLAIYTFRLEVTGVIYYRTWSNMIRKVNHLNNVFLLQFHELQVKDAFCIHYRIYEVIDRPNDHISIKASMAYKDFCSLECEDGGTTFFKNVGKPFTRFHSVTSHCWLRNSFLGTGR
jgi:hypothetical protein